MEIHRPCRWGTCWLFTEQEALESLRESILLLLENRREDARPMVLRTGFDHAGFNRLTDDLEAEAFLDSTNKLSDHSR